MLSGTDATPKSMSKQSLNHTIVHLYTF